jgi:diguanylate cyclase (GGDEF)-like protein
MFPSESAGKTHELQTGSPMGKLETTNRRWLFLLGLLIAAILRVLDLLIGQPWPFRYSLLPFCWVSVVFIAWYAGKWQAIVASGIIALGWFLTGPASMSDPLATLMGRFYSFLYSALFVVFAIPIAQFMEALHRARETSWKDSLTQALNAQYFFGRASAEISRATRYQRTFTIAWFSINDFPAFRARLGSQVANALLALTADALKTNLRSVDLVGRVGDDEFAVLLPETGHQQAQVVLPRLRERLLANLQQRSWSPTFTVCAVACPKPPKSLDALVGTMQAEIADARKGKKEGIIYRELGASDGAVAPPGGGQ